MISKLNLSALFITLAAAVAAVGAEPAVRRDPFPSTIPEAFGFNTHYWDFAKDGKWNMEQWDVWWGKLDPLAGMAKSGFTIHRSTVAGNENEPSPGT